MKDLPYIPPKKDILSLKMIIFVWLLIFIISAIHYFSPPDLIKVHDLMRRFYYIPIVYAALQMGLKGGLFSSFIVTCLYIPHAFLLHGMHKDPANGIEKFLEILLYFTIAFIVGYFSDKDRKQKEKLRELLAKQKELTDLLVQDGKMKVLGEVVAGLTHEIKNPLHVMLGTAEIIEDFIPKEAEERKLWKNHVSEIKRLKRIVEKYLDFSKANNQEKKTVNVNEVLDKIIGLVESDARKKEIKIVRNYISLVTLDINEDQLIQIILNILINAIKAMETSGDTIIIETKKHKEILSILIKNNGPKIPKDKHNLIFRPFYSSSTERSGLGLSLVSKLMNENNGYIELKQTEKFTEFYLNFKNS